MEQQKSDSSRTIIIIVAALAVIVAIAFATGFINLDGDAGKLPEVQVQGGRAPSVDADVGSVDVGTTSTDVTVPKVEVGTTSEKIEVPTVSVKPADGN